MGMLDFKRDPRAEEDAPFLGDDDAPCFSPPDDLAELARRSFRNWSLFMAKYLDSPVRRLVAVVRVCRS